MLILALTTDKIQLVTDAAATLAVTACGADISGTTVTLWKQNTAISTAATTDVVAAPAASTVRNVKTVHIRNTHATLAVGVTILYNANATTYEVRKETLQAGDHLDYVEGVGWFRSAASSLVTLVRTLTADATGQNVATVQPWFPATGSANVAASTTYWMQGRLIMTRAAGTTSHTTSLQFGGTATLTSIDATAWCNTGDVLTTLASSETDISAATATAVKAASVSATEAIEIAIDGILRTNAAGTFIPQFIFSAAPGGNPTIKRSTYLNLTPWGSNVLSAVGSWV